MKKTILLCTLVAIVTFGAGWFTNQKVNKVSNEEIQFLIEANEFKYELIDAQDEALELSWKVMWNNNLFDTDDSDDMIDYLEAYCKVDSLYATQL